MERNIKIKGITLKKIELGESNLGLTILTETDEVIFLIAFGGSKAKSKLFGSISPFVLSNWDLYFDPIKEHWRAKDASVITFNSEIQQSLEHFYAASLFAEIILKSQGSEGVFNLLNSTLYYIKDIKNTSLVVIQFILRLLTQQGLFPSMTHCSVCDKKIILESLYYSGREELICKNCYSDRNGLEINQGIIKYCINTPQMEMGKSFNIGLQDSSVEKLKNLLIQLIKNYTGGKLLTLNSSNGLI